jgi:hypothetical protein
MIQQQVLAESTVLGKGTIVRPSCRTRSARFGTRSTTKRCVYYSHANTTSDAVLKMGTCGCSPSATCGTATAQALYRLARSEFEAVTDAPWPSAKACCARSSPRAARFGDRRRADKMAPTRTTICTTRSRTSWTQCLRGMYRHDSKVLEQY